MKAAGQDGQGDMDVTVLAFAQWVTEMKTRQHGSQHQMQAEMSIIRNAIAANDTDLTDFKRHSATIQQQMQAEISEVRESLSSVFMEITTAVRNNAASDRDMKLKLQALKEQSVRNETAFAQLADAADQSQTKLRNAVQELQDSSERVSEELKGLTRTTDTLESVLSGEADGLSMKLDQLGQDHHVQLERGKEHVRKMVSDVMLIGESLQSLVADFGEQKRLAAESQGKLKASLAAIEDRRRKQQAASDGGSLQVLPASGRITVADPLLLVKLQQRGTGNSTPVLTTPLATTPVPTPVATTPAVPAAQPLFTTTVPRVAASVAMPAGAALPTEPVASAPQLSLTPPPVIR